MGSSARTPIAGLLAGGALAWCLGCAEAAAAAGPDHGPWGIEVGAGALKLQEGDWDYSAPGPQAGIEIARELAPGWSLLAGLRHGYARAGVDEPFADAGWSGGGQPYYTVTTQPLLLLRHRLASGSAFSPYLGGGCGLNSWKVLRSPAGAPGLFPREDPVVGYDLAGDPAPLEGTDFFWEVRGGCDVFVGGNLALGAYAFYQAGQGNERDSSGLSSLWGPAHVDANRAAAGGFVGVAWWFGRRDKDGDGVPDDRDECPTGVEDRDGYNDRDGCPDPDNDGDGVPDDRDLCPDLPEDYDGFEDADGCPERDNDRDGVPDGRDRCPDTPPGALVDADGCALAGR